MLREPERHRIGASAGEIRRGWLTHTIDLGGDELLLGRAWTPHLPALAQAFEWRLESERPESPSAALELS